MTVEPSSPTAAIGSVELGAAPEASAPSLAAVAELPSLGPPTEPADDELSAVLALLRRVTGIDFAGYERTTVVRRIHRRLALHRLTTFAEYEELLQREPGEADELGEALLVHVTGFFRDPPVFEALQKLVFPRLIEGRSRDAPLRLWVPGCSTGEEPYSLAITLLDFLSRERIDLPVKVFATDISQRTIEKARAGRYAEAIAERVPPAALQRFFEKTGDGYQVSRELRDQCVFARQDLTRDPPFSNMDLISCRNLMIYLAPTLQRRVLPIFHYALRPSGHLVLGAAETIGAFAGFDPVDPQNKIFVRSARATRSPGPGGHRTWEVPSVADAQRRQPATQQELHQQADRAILAACAPAGVVVTDDGTVVQFRGSIGPFLEPVSGAASLGLLRLAREELRPALRDTLAEAQRTGARCRAAFVRLRDAGRDRWVDVEVLPLAAAPREPRHYVVLFHESAPPPLPADGAPADCATAAALGRELASTRAYLQSVIEQHESANEDLRACNEELQSTNEELQTAQEELMRDARDYAQSVVDAVREPLLVVDEELRVRSANRAYHQRFQASPVDTEDRRVDEVLAGSWSAAPLRRYLQDAAAGEPGDGFRLERAEGADQRALVLHGSRIPRGIHGGPWVLISFEDVTQREQADAVRERAGRALREILAASATTEGIVIVDRRRKIVFANRTAKRMFGYEPGELVGLPLDNLLPEALRARHDEHVRAFHEAPEARPMFKGRVVTARRKDGVEIAVEVGLGLVEDEAGPMVVALCTDVAARRTSDTQIHAYEQKLSAMALDAAIAEERRAPAHRRRSPRSRRPDPRAPADPAHHPARHPPPEAREGVFECVRMIEQSIAETRTLTFDLSPPILYDFGLKAAVGWLAEQFAARHQLEITVEGLDVLELDVDVASVLFRVVRELLTNVVKHAHSPRAKVVFHRAGAAIAIDVEDSGVGFDASILGARATRGFGLLSVREQVGRLGGTFELTSSSGSGTRITLRVPLAAQAVANSRGTEP